MNEREEKRLNSALDAYRVDLSPDRLERLTERILQRTMDREILVFSPMGFTESLGTCSAVGIFAMLVMAMARVQEAGSGLLGGYWAW